jgi:hypothetical protein
MTMVKYASTDASAPTLQGIVGGALSGSDWAAGSWLQLLRKVLVTGYGSGAQSAGAGWTQSFAGTSEGVFRQASGCQFYLHVLDDGSMTAGAREANMYGSENQTAISTSTAKFPTAAQVANGILIRKSDTADTTQRQWVIFADDKTFYAFVWTGNATPYYAGFAFGDFYSYVSGDAYNCMIIGRTTSSATDALTNEMLDKASNIGSTITGHFIARGYNQLGTSINCSKIGRFLDTSASTTLPIAATGYCAYPNPSDGKLWLSRCYIGDTVTNPTNSIRGFLRGFWASQTAGFVLPLEYTINGSGGLSGRTFKVLGLRSGNSTDARYVMETSNTWD